MLWLTLFHPHIKTIQPLQYTPLMCLGPSPTTLTRAVEQQWGVLQRLRISNNIKTIYPTAVPKPFSNNIYYIPRLQYISLLWWIPSSPNPILFPNHANTPMLHLIYYTMYTRTLYLTSQFMWPPSPLPCTLISHLMYYTSLQWWTHSSSQCTIYMYQYPILHLIVTSSLSHILYPTFQYTSLLWWPLYSPHCYISLPYTTYFCDEQWYNVYSIPLLQLIAVVTSSRRGRDVFSPMFLLNTSTYLAGKTVVNFDRLLIYNSQSNSMLLLCDVTD